MNGSATDRVTIYSDIGCPFTHRIEALLRDALDAGPADLRAMAALQADVGSDRPRRLIGHALALADTETLGPEARELAQILAGWDGRAEAGSVGAAAYHVFASALTRGLIEERLGPELTTAYLAYLGISTRSIR